MKSPLPGNGQMGNDPEIKGSSSVYKEKQPCRREIFLSCQPSRFIGFVTTEKQRTNEQTTELLWALHTGLPEPNFEEAATALGIR